MRWREKPWLNIAQGGVSLFRPMRSRAVASFWNGYNRLPSRIQELADKQYRLWLNDPGHPSVRFKKVGSYWSARITDDYRAVGIMDEDAVIWFFIGRHDEYTQLLKA
jgi:Txe/YoeB family toxin of Txe-Axe toxin-antitoxin module